MSKLDELNARFNAKYGEEWDRNCDLTEDEEHEWIDACYEYYATECVKKDVFGGPYSDMAEEWYGHPFEILRPVPYGDPEYDPISLPIWIIRITDKTGEKPGEFAAYPEELFIDPAQEQ